MNRPDWIDTLRADLRPVDPDPVLLAQLAQLSSRSAVPAPRPGRSAGARWAMVLGGVIAVGATSWAAGALPGTDSPFSPEERVTQQPTDPPSDEPAPPSTDPPPSEDRRSPDRTEDPGSPAPTDPRPGGTPSGVPPTSTPSDGDPPSPPVELPTLPDLPQLPGVPAVPEPPGLDRVPDLPVLPPLADSDRGSHRSPLAQEDLVAQAR
jgi:hypothetical protein